MGYRKGALITNRLMKVKVKDTLYFSNFEYTQFNMLANRWKLYISLDIPPLHFYFQWDRFYLKEMLEMQDETGETFLNFRGREMTLVTKFKKNHTKFRYKLNSEISNIYPVNNGITRTMSEICSKLTVKTPQISWMVSLWFLYCWL